MKLFKKAVISILGISTLVGSVVGCGSANNAANPASPIGLAGVNYTNTLTGQNICYPLIAGTPAYIPFMVTGGNLNSYVVKAGIIPYGLDSFPSGGVSSGTITPSFSSPALQLPGTVFASRAETDGGLLLNVTNYGVGGYVYVSAAKATIIAGLYRISGTSLMGGYPSSSYGFNMYTPVITPGSNYGYSQVCVSNIAFSMSHAGQVLNGGRVFLYLNGTAHGDYLEL